MVDLFSKSWIALLTMFSALLRKLTLNPAAKYWGDPVFPQKNYITGCYEYSAVDWILFPLRACSLCRWLNQNSKHARKGCRVGDAAWPCYRPYALASSSAVCSTRTFAPRWLKPSISCILQAEQPVATTSAPVDRMSLVLSARICWDRS